LVDSALISLCSQLRRCEQPWRQVEVAITYPSVGVETARRKLFHIFFSPFYQSCPFFTLRSASFRTNCKAKEEPFFWPTKEALRRKWRARFQDSRRDRMLLHSRRASAYTFATSAGISGKGMPRQLAEVEGDVRQRLCAPPCRCRQDAATCQRV
jgi:hypothetical protein